MRYRNRFVFGAAVVGVVAQPIVAVAVMPAMETDSDRLVDAAALISLASLGAWLFARIGVQPSIRCETGIVCVDNPLFSYRAALSEVQFIARDGGIGLCVEGLGAMHPWVLSKSIFDGKRARSARREIRELVAEAHNAAISKDGRLDGITAARRWIRWGVVDVLIVAPLVFSIWNVVDIVANG